MVRLEASKKNAINKIIDEPKNTNFTCKIVNAYRKSNEKQSIFSYWKGNWTVNKNGLDIGIKLHSRKTRVKIVNHIAKEIKKLNIYWNNYKNLKLSIILNEISTSAPVIFLVKSGFFFQKQFFLF